LTNGLARPNTAHRAQELGSVNAVLGRLAMPLAKKTEMKIVGKEISKLKIDKRLLSVVTSLDQTDDSGYWLSKKPIERIGHIELLRRINYGDGATSRLQRVLEFTED
ncbi:hypothetical protein, partial [Candidatus Thiosymbion oneisti]|uniref:hypothetical protein n=2 Tax=Candidatus Thiosymbion oneisti TaxID=589554 RepID=UPI0014151DD6